MGVLLNAYAETASVNFFMLRLQRAINTSFGNCSSVAMSKSNVAIDVMSSGCCCRPALFRAESSYLCTFY